MPSYGVGLLLAIAAPLPAQDCAGLFAQSRTAGVDAPPGIELRRHAARAVPFLVDVLRCDTDGAARDRALEHLMRLGAQAEPAVPAMLAALDGDDHLCLFTAVALGEVVPFLAAATRAAVVDALLRCRRQRADAVPRLELQLARACARSLLPATRDAAALAQALRSDNPFLVELACQHAGELDAAARELLPQVAELLRRSTFPATTFALPDHPDVPLRVSIEWQPHVRDAAFALLQRVDPDHPAALPLLTERLTRAPPLEQARLLQQIGHMGPAAGGQVHFVAAFTQAAPPAGREAVTTLGMIGKGSDEARAVLTGLLEHHDAQLAARARAALRQLDAAAAH